MGESLVWFLLTELQPPTRKLSRAGQHNKIQVKEWYFKSSTINGGGVYKHSNSGKLGKQIITKSILPLPRIQKSSVSKACSPIVKLKEPHIQKENNDGKVEQNCYYNLCEFKIVQRKKIYVKYWFLVQAHRHRKRKPRPHHAII